MKQKPASLKFPRQGKLLGKLRQYDVTYQELGEFVGLTASGVEAIVNGRVDFKLSIARKIKTYLVKKSKLELALSDIIE